MHACRSTLEDPTVKGDPTLPNGPFGVPPPKVLASHTWIEQQGALLGDRVGVCRVRDTEGRRDIVTHAHSGNRLQTWAFGPNGSGGFALTMLHFRDQYTGNVARTHEFNAEDIDGDGFDEFFMDGVIDFVDGAPGTGLATPTNAGHPSSGVQVWSTGYNGVSENHMDQMIAADFDPAHPGFEINSVPSQGFTTWNGVVSNGRDMLWDISGGVLGNNTNAPAPHGQGMTIGNWSSARAGLETIYVPKGAGMGPQYLGATYSTSATQEELTFDGALFIAGDPIGQRAGGPVNQLDQMDWDGDYGRDEIVSHAWTTLDVWRIGEKLDWLPGPMPAGMPTSAAQALQTFNAAGQVGGPYTWYWYANNPAWAFNFGGAGRYSHYYQKLGEAFAGGRWALRPYDVGSDYREEVVALTANPGTPGVFVDVYYNLAALAKPWKHLSPRASTTYHRFRTEMVHSPLVYADLPVAERLVVTPRTVGMNTVGGSQQFAAQLVYSDGTSVDVSQLVTWSSEIFQVATISASGLASSAGTRGSTKIVAALDGLPCDAAYLYASAIDAPEILYAGYEHSYVVQSTGPNMKLHVEARVAQRANQPLYVFMIHNTGLYWPYPTLPIEYCGLYDDGLAAHGDDVAGDGIYSNVIPYAGHTSVLAAGDNLRPIVAVLASNTSVVSRPWPYYVRGPTPPPPLPNITGQFDNDAQGDARTPRVDWAGLRGFDDANYAFVEVHLIPPSDPNVAITDCKIQLNGTNPFAKVPTGDDHWVAYFNVAGMQNGAYFVDAWAEAFDSVQQVTVYSDHWPRIRNH